MGLPKKPITQYGMISNITIDDDLKDEDSTKVTFWTEFPKSKGGIQAIPDRMSLIEFKQICLESEVSYTDLAAWCGVKVSQVVNYALPKDEGRYSGITIEGDPKTSSEHTVQPIKGHNTGTPTQTTPSPVLGLPEASTGLFCDPEELHKDWVCPDCYGHFTVFLDDDLSRYPCIASKCINSKIDHFAASNPYLTAMRGLQWCKTEGEGSRPEIKIKKFADVFFFGRPLKGISKGISMNRIIWRCSLKDFYQIYRYLIFIRHVGVEYNLSRVLSIRDLANAYSAAEYSFAQFNSLDTIGLYCNPGLVDKMAIQFAYNFAEERHGTKKNLWICLPDYSQSRFDGFRELVKEGHYLLLP